MRQARAEASVAAAKRVHPPAGLAPISVGGPPESLLFDSRFDDLPPTPAFEEGGGPAAEWGGEVLPRQPSAIDEGEEDSEGEAQMRQLRASYEVFRATEQAAAAQGGVSLQLSLPQLAALVGFGAAVGAAVAVAAARLAKR